VFFPTLYMLFYIYGRRHIKNIQIPLEVKLFVLWGLVISIPNLLSYPITTGVGILVNTLFIPVAYLSIHLYPDLQSLRPLFKRLSFFAAAVGILALYQSTLPFTHWLNMAVDDVTAVYGRVSSSFQFSNVFGSYAIGGTIACLVSWSLAQNQGEKIFSFLCLLFLYSGVLFSGSRMGAIGVLPIFLIMLAFSEKNQRKDFIAILVIVGIALLFLNISNITEFFSSFRAFGAGDRLDNRISGMYFGTTLQSAWESSEILGFGWGIHTMGVGLHFSQFEDVASSYIGEGGYGTLLVELSLVGFLFFLAMHQSFFRFKKNLGSLKWFGFAVGTWSLLGNIPAPFLQISVLAIYWWFLAGLYWRFSYAKSHSYSYTKKSLRVKTTGKVMLFKSKNI